MIKYLLPQTGNFYKANLHCHTTFSDGLKTPAEIKELYQKLGYSIVAYTDHDIFIPHDELTDDSFLSLHGFEAEIDEKGNKYHAARKCCHICFVALEPDNLIQPCWHRTKYLWGNSFTHRNEVKFDENEPDFVRSYSSECINKMMRTAREKGFFVTYNHPTWSRERYPDYIDYAGMHAMEIMNGGCIATGYEDYNPRVYDDFLTKGTKIYCIGADDNHNLHEPDSRYCDSGWAFTMIKAENLKYRTVTKALENGEFYASEGPEIYGLWVEGDRVHIKCSAADKIECIYGVREGGIVLSEEGIPVTEAVFPIRREQGYFRITVTDERGKHACTNAYFMEDIIR